MITTKAYIPTPDLNDFAKSLNGKGLAAYLDKECCASTYAGRFGRDLDECYESMMSKISEFDLHYINGADFIPEYMFRLWQFEDAVPPVITIYLAYNFITEKVEGLYTKAAIKSFPGECLRRNCIMMPIPCEVPRPKKEG